MPSSFPEGPGHRVDGQEVWKKINESAGREVKRNQEKGGNRKYNLTIDFGSLSHL